MIERLKKRREFLAVAGTRRRVAMPGLVLQVRRWSADHPAPANGPALRIGFTASRKVGGAVVRNRAKRRLRALAEEVMTRDAARRHDYVLIARADTSTRDFDLLRRDLRSALDRLRLREGRERAA